MTRCGHCQALQGAEAQVLRLQRDVREFIKLLTNAREDGGLTKVQCELFDRLTARHEAVLAGRDTDGQGTLPGVLARCDVPDVETLLAGWDCLREIALEIGEITTLDTQTFEDEDRTAIQPQFGLQCRIRDIVAHDGAVACCGHTGPRTAVAEVEHERV